MCTTRISSRALAVVARRRARAFWRPLAQLRTGPTSTPCGVCNSCVDLAPNGPGSIDVIELDAATHGLVDDARDLREKAVYAPASNRYKIYIIDEAHQLGPGAANALLKLVEEPPPPLALRLRHNRARQDHRDDSFPHAPLRIPTGARTNVADTPRQHLRTGELLPTRRPALISRAAGGSVRDSLSILGQLLMCGSGPKV